RVRWRPHASEKDRVDLLAGLGLTPRDGAGVAYAGCWGRSDKDREALLATGSDGGIKGWLNPKPLLDKEGEREAQAGSDKANVELRAGWNEIRVKLDGGGGAWGFLLELRDRDGGQPLRGLEYRTTPP